MRLKKCLGCGAMKRPSEFYGKGGGREGLEARCKACRMRRWKEDMQEHPDKNRLRANNYNARHRDRAREQSRRKYRRNIEGERLRNLGFIRRNKEKRQAQGAVRVALRDGSLVRLPCQHCGSADSQVHHLDYGHPRRVLWLCSVCRGYMRRKEKPEWCAALAAEGQ